VAEKLSSDLLSLLSETFSPGDVIETLSRKQPNWIQGVGPEGVLIETEKSRRERKGPQLVPGWMLQRAWDYLQQHGSLTNSHLVSTNGLNVKRSAAVSALLSRLPGVAVESDRPIKLVLVRG
jgi:hypothetical protein